LYVSVLVVPTTDLVSECASSPNYWPCK